MTDLYARPAGPSDAVWPAADEIALEELRPVWEPIYDLGIADGALCAYRWPDGPLLSAATADGLESAIRTDWARSR